MKTQSTVTPDKIWIRGLSNGLRTINLTKNVVKIKKEEQDIFEYDEITVTIQERDNLEKYVTDNFDELFNLGQTQFANKKYEEFSNECANKILGGFTSNCLGEDKIFDSGMGNQATIQGLVLTALLNKSGLMPKQEILEHKTINDAGCYPFTNEQIIKLGLDLKAHITACKKDAELKMSELFK
jgi:hypothetical protein